MSYLPVVGAVTPVAGSAVAIATGGVAVIVVNGPCNGGFITNPLNSTAQGITTAENAYVGFSSSIGSTDSGGNGTAIILSPGQSFSVPNLASSVKIYANAASTGHKLTVVVW